MKYINKYNDAATFSTNTGTEPLVFLCICTPRFKSENYINMEIREEYTPVPCQLHSELELAVMHQEVLEIVITDDTKIKGRAIDIFTKDKGEYLKVKGSDGEVSNIRLDMISSYKIIK